jgi:hypothetical protein
MERASSYSDIGRSRRDARPHRGEEEIGSVPEGSTDVKAQTQWHMWKAASPVFGCSSSQPSSAAEQQLPLSVTHAAVLTTSAAINRSAADKAKWASGRLIGSNSTRTRGQYKTITETGQDPSEFRCFGARSLIREAGRIAS